MDSVDVLHELRQMRLEQQYMNESILSAIYVHVGMKSKEAIATAKQVTSDSQEFSGRKNRERTQRGHFQA